MTPSDINIAILGRNIIQSHALLTGLEPGTPIPDHMVDERILPSPDDGKWYDRIQKAIEREGFRFTEDWDQLSPQVQTHPRMQGLTVYSGGNSLFKITPTVAVRPNLPLAQKRSTALHEYAHVVTAALKVIREPHPLDIVFGPPLGEPHPTQLWEMLAEAASWKVHQVIGWQERAYAPMYLALYAIKEEWLERYQSEIDAVAERMLQGLGWKSQATLAEAA